MSTFLYEKCLYTHTVVKLNWLFLNSIRCVLLMSQNIKIKSNVNRVQILILPMLLLFICASQSTKYSQRNHVYQDILKKKRKNDISEDLSTGQNITNVFSKIINFIESRFDSQHIIIKP